MTLGEALAYTENQKKRLGSQFYSDGCTYAPDLGITKWCVMHDVLRRYKPVSALEADNIFFRGICTKGIRYYPVAVIYWSVVRFTYLTGFIKN